MRWAAAGVRSARTGSAVMAIAGCIALTPAVAYLTTLTVAATWARRRGLHITPTAGVPATRFAVFVPAHDEERLIADTVRSLLEVDYPAELFEVHVIADHCTDRTAVIARCSGATVHEHVDPEPTGKGPALQWLFDQLDQAGAGFDAVVIIDADTVVNHRFLGILDARFRNGAEVVQAHYAVRDADLSSATALRAAALSTRHYLRPLGRTTIGASSGLYGNGMAFSRRVMGERTWSDHLTEDLELQSELVLDGVTVEFAPDAVVLAEMPQTLKAARSQNERWERGRIELARRYVPRLAKGALRRRPPSRRIALIDTAVDHTIAPFSVVTSAALAVAACGATARTLESTRLSRASLGWSLGLCTMLGLHVLAGLRMVGASRSVYRALWHAPRMILWKAGIWSRMMVPSKAVPWLRTTRN